MQWWCPMSRNKTSSEVYWKSYVVMRYKSGHWCLLENVLIYNEYRELGYWYFLVCYFNILHPTLESQSLIWRLDSPQRANLQIVPNIVSIILSSSVHTVVLGAVVPQLQLISKFSFLQNILQLYCFHLIVYNPEIMKWAMRKCSNINYFYCLNISANAVNFHLRRKFVPVLEFLLDY